MKAKTTNIVAAVALSALTITVFAASRNSGPESSIRRFHEGISRRDQSILRQVAMTPRTIGGQQVALLVEQLILQGAKVRLGQVQKNPPNSVVEVAYLMSDGRTWALRVFLVRQSGTWMIDLDQTANASSPNQGGAIRFN